MNILGMSYVDRLNLLSFIKHVDMENKFTMIFSFLDSLYVGLDRDAGKVSVEFSYDVIRHFNTLTKVASNVRELPPFDTEYAGRFDRDDMSSRAYTRPFPTVDLQMDVQPSNAMILKFKSGDKSKFYIATGDEKQWGGTFYIAGGSGTTVMPSKADGLVARYRSTVDIGAIAAHETSIKIYTDCQVRNDQQSPAGIFNTLIPSLSREVYYHSDMSSFSKIPIGPYLLEASPLSIRDKSEYYRALSQTGEGWLKQRILADDLMMDYDAITYVFSYLNGFTDGNDMPNHTIPYESLLRCWHYINYLQIPLISLFVQNYIIELFIRAPGYKDLRIHGILKGIYEQSPFSKVLEIRGRVNTFEATILERLLEDDTEEDEE